MLVSISLFMCSPVLATIAQTNPSPDRGASNVHVDKDFTIQINGTNGNINGNFTLYKDSVLTATTQAITEQANGTQTFTLTTLDGSTNYTVYVHVNDSDNTPLNYSYSFVTRAKPLTLDTDNFGTTEILLLGLITVFIIIGFVVSFVKDLKDGKKLKMKDLITKLVLVIFFGIVIMIIGSLI